MKLLHVIQSVNSCGGGPIEFIRQCAPVMLRRGHLVEVASLDDPGAAFLKEIDLRVNALGPSHLRYSYSTRLVPWLKRNASRYDAVIVNGIWQYSSFGVWRSLRKSSIPYFVFTHGMLDPWFKRTYPLKHFKKWLYWPWGEYRVLRDARAVLFTCEQERILARKSFWMYQCNEAVVSYGTGGANGDASRQHGKFLETFPEMRGKRALLYLSRIHEKKGCDLLIRAFASAARNFPSLYLVMAGPDQSGLRNKLESIAASLGISDRIVWTGMISGDVKWGAFHHADAFVLPSHQENFGVAITEAMSCGVPVLISDQVNIWREVKADDAGLVAPDTIEGTIQNLQNWLAMSEEERRRKRARARASFLNRFHIDMVATILVETLKRHGVRESA